MSGHTSLRVEHNLSLRFHCSMNNKTSRIAILHLTSKMQVIWLVNSKMVIAFAQTFDQTLATRTNPSHLGTGGSGRCNNIPLLTHITQYSDTAAGIFLFFNSQVNRVKCTIYENRQLSILNCSYKKRMYNKLYFKGLFNYSSISQTYVHDSLVHQNVTIFYNINIDYVLYYIIY